MADVFTNDLRIREQEVGANSGAWGGYLNTSLSNLAESWSYGNEALADSAAQTLTLADGASDQLRSFYVKLTGTLSQATTVTIAPNTISKSWMIENATTGGYAVTISQGSGANVVVGNGNVKMIATDGAGSGGVVYDLLTDLELAGTLQVTKASSGATPTAGTVLTVEDDDNAELSILGGSSSLLAINFGHSGDADDGIITYNTTSGSENMAFTVNASNRMTIDKDGKVGIGTASPTGLPLHLKVSSGDNKLQMQTANKNAYVMELEDSTGNLKLGTNTTAGALVIADAGNVGIGTTTPGSFNGAGNDLVVGAGTSGNNNGMTIYSNSNSTGHLLFADGTSGSEGYTGYVGYTHSSDYMSFHTNSGLERMRIRSDGNVGIGAGGMACYSAYRQLSVGAMAHIMGTTASSTTGSLHISQNAHFETDGTWETMETDHASNYYQYGGGHYFRVSGVTSAGTDISFINAMSLTDTGDMSVNGTVSSTSYIDGKLATNIVSSRRVAFYSNGNLDATFRAQSSNSAYVGIMAGATRLNNDASYFYFANNTNANGGSWSAYIKHITGANAAVGKMKHLTCDGSLWHNALEITNTGTDKVLTNSGNVGTISDQRLKTGIQDFTYSMSTFKSLRPRSFSWINPDQHQEGLQEGFIAQELPESLSYTNVLDQEVSSGNQGENKPNPDLELVPDAQSLASSLGTTDAMYVSIIQQLITKIEALETDVAALKGA